MSILKSWNWIWNYGVGFGLFDFFDQHKKRKSLDHRVVVLHLGDELFGHGFVDIGDLPLVISSVCWFIFIDFNFVIIFLI